jgi:hypothetical protein
LPFFIHKFCRLKDEAYKKCCKKLGNKALVWQKFRDYSEVIILDSWHRAFDLCFSIPPPWQGAISLKVIQSKKYIFAKVKGMHFYQKKLHKMVLI